MTFSYRGGDMVIAEEAEAQSEETADGITGRMRKHLDASAATAGKRVDALEAEMKRQREDTKRQHEETMRQHEETKQQLEDTKRQHEETSRLLAVIMSRLPAGGH
jgi:hypothetical protein